MMHKPVMLTESIDALINNPNGCYVDGTIGGGGHCTEILNRLSQKGKVIGFDCDIEAINRMKSTAQKDSRLTLVHDNFLNISNYLDKYKIPKVNGVILDLGVSSFQLDQPERGFSFLQDAPLDMRMDQTQLLDAKYWLNTASEEEMASVFYRLGEEKMSRRIAYIICEYRKKIPLESTFQLVELIKKIKGSGGRSKIHPATKTFQAIRMLINNELDNFEKTLTSMIHRIYSGGKFVVLTFHSLEDRLVKRFFNKHIQKEVNLQEGGSVYEGNKPYVRWMNKKPLRASSDEVSINNRARSAKLRVVTVQG